MDKSVIISIKGVQTALDGEPEVMELVTEGKLTDYGDNGYSLSYQESELTGMEGTLTTFQVEPGQVTLLRVGEVNSQMVFRPGRPHLSLYETPYGSLSIGVKTRKMRADLGPAGGDIEIDYAVEIDNALVGQNLFQVNVREKPSALKQ